MIIDHHVHHTVLQPSFHSPCAPHSAPALIPFTMCTTQCSSPHSIHRLQHMYLVANKKGSILQDVL